MTITDISAAGETRSDGTPRVPDERQRYVTLLADLARILREHPGIPKPDIYTDEIRFAVFGSDAREIIAAARRAIGGTWAKQPRENQYGTYLDYTREWHGFPVRLTTARDEVCRKVVTGTREVTRKVPDPEALAKVPEIEVTETEEISEWVCEPLLAPRTAELADEASKAVA